jgi:hypothetical protein
VLVPFDGGVTKEKRRVGVTWRCRAPGCSRSAYSCAKIEVRSGGDRGGHDVVGDDDDDSDDVLPLLLLASKNDSALCMGNHILFLLSS